jgi:hypothetical protein
MPPKDYSDGEGFAPILRVKNFRAEVVVSVTENFVGRACKVSWSFELYTQKTRAER